MKNNIKALVLAMLVPIIAICQVQVHKTSSATVSNIISFYSPSLISGSQVVNFPFIRPAIRVGGVPTNLNIDPSYDNLDDTTYETNPIFDLGRVINTNLTLANGNWQTTSYGKIWCLKISIDNALNTGLHFGGFSLSPTANFYILNGDLSMIKGPYIKDGLPDNGIFGTFPMNSSSCYLFLQETNAANIAQNNLQISAVVAGVQNIDDDIAPPSGTTRVSNGCIPSIRCFNDWMTTARAVSRWDNGKGSFCTGTLLNNEKSDGTNYYYSAHHCLPGNIGDLTMATFQFQYWQTGCNTNIDQPWVEFYGGATLLHDVGYNDGDAILLRLNNGPGIGDGVTYAGWTRSTSAPSQTGSVIIHHPDKGDMRFTQTDRVRQFLWDADFWKASYLLGVMLPGSSGSALFTENHQVIGTLSRGTSSCFWYFLGDRFGKFQRGWGGMQQYLSPVQNKNDIAEMPLFPLSIAGNGTVGCATGPQDYSVPNLATCTYLWTVSPNLAIQSGQGTGKVSVFFAANPIPADAGWVNVVIRDSKGKVENRRVEMRKDLSTNSAVNQLNGTYSTNSSTKPIQTFNTVPAGYIYAQYQWPGVSNITARLTSGSSAGTGFNSYGSFCTFSLLSGQSISIYFTGTGACGPVSATRSFVQSSYRSFSLSASPNPAKNNIKVSIAEVPDTSSATLAKMQAMDAPVNATGTTKMYLYNFNTNALVKQWTYQETKTLHYNLNIAGLKSGYYILKMERDNKTTTTKILVE